MRNTPPQFFPRFFRWFCHPKLRDSIEGDLMELYYERVPWLLFGGKPSTKNEQPTTVSLPNNTIHAAHHQNRAPKFATLT